MANEFKIKKGLIVTGASGGTVVDIQGSQGQLKRKYIRCVRYIWCTDIRCQLKWNILL